MYLVILSGRIVSSDTSFIIFCLNLLCKLNSDTLLIIVVPTFLRFTIKIKCFERVLFFCTVYMVFHIVTLFRNVEK